MMTMIRHLLFCVLAVAIGACAIFGGPADRALRRTPSYQAGYADGCSAASAVGADYRRSVGPDPAYRNDRVYHAGWSNGFQTCNRTIAPPGSTEPGNPIPEPSPGH